MAAAATDSLQRQQKQPDLSKLKVKLQFALRAAAAEGVGVAGENYCCFDLFVCLKALLHVSHECKWSFRDLKQFISAVKYEIMCNDR